MAEQTGIEWTDSTWTPIRARRFVGDTEKGWPERIGWHCEHVSEGCRNCYAERMNGWVGTGVDYKPANLKHTNRWGESLGDVTVFLDAHLLLQPQRWRKGRRIFVCSMTDLFADFVTDDMLDSMFAVMANAPQHTFQVLTKRSARMRRYLSDPGRARIIDDRACTMASAGDLRVLDDPQPWPLPNVVLMVSAERQREADERIPDLLATPAAVRGVSVEPMLGPVDLTSISVRIGAGVDVFSALEYDGDPDDDVEFGTGVLDWVICGGESGPGARPMHPDWARSLRDQCAAAGAAFMFKQWGEWTPGENVEQQRGTVDTAFLWDDGWHVYPLNLATDGGHIDDQPDLYRVGKRAAGRLLDGRTHDEFPEVQHG